MDLELFVHGSYQFEDVIASNDQSRNDNNGTNETHETHDTHVKERTRTRRPHGSLASLTPHAMLEQAASAGQALNFVAPDGEPFMCMAATSAMDTPLKLLTETDLSSYVMDIQNSVPLDALYPANIGCLFAQAPSSSVSATAWVVAAATASSKKRKNREPLAPGSDSTSASTSDSASGSVSSSSSALALLCDDALGFGDLAPALAPAPLVDHPIDVDSADSSTLPRAAWMQNAISFAESFNLHEAVWEFVRRAGVYRFPQSSPAQALALGSAALAQQQQQLSRGGGCLSMSGESKAVQGGGFHGAHGILRRPIRALLELVVLYVEEFVHDSAQPPEMRRNVISLTSGPGAMLAAVQALSTSYVASAMMNAARKDHRTTRRTGVVGLTARGARLRPESRDVLGASAVLATAAEVLSDEESDVDDLAARAPIWMKDSTFEPLDAAWRRVQCLRTGRLFSLQAHTGAYVLDSSENAETEVETAVETEAGAGAESAVFVDAVTGVITFQGDAGERARQEAASAYMEMLKGMRAASLRHRVRRQRLQSAETQETREDREDREDRDKGEDSGYAAEDDELGGAVRRLPCIHFSRLRRRRPSAPLAVGDDGRPIKRSVGRPRGQGPKQLARAAAEAAMSAATEAGDTALIAQLQDMHRTSRSTARSTQKTPTQQTQTQQTQPREEEQWLPIETRVDMQMQQQMQIQDQSHGPMQTQTRPQPQKQTQEQKPRRQYRKSATKDALAPDEAKQERKRKRSTGPRGQDVASWTSFPAFPSVPFMPSMPLVQSTGANESFGQDEDALCALDSLSAISELSAPNVLCPVDVPNVQHVSNESRNFRRRASSLKQSTRVVRSKRSTLFLESVHNVPDAEVPHMQVPDAVPDVVLDAEVHNKNNQVPDLPDEYEGNVDQELMEDNGAYAGEWDDTFSATDATSSIGSAWKTAICLDF